MESEKRTISLMSFVGLHASASDEIFSELEMFCWASRDRWVLRRRCHFLVGEVLKGNIDFENGRLFGQKRGYFLLLLQIVAMWQEKLV